MLGEDQYSFAKLKIIQYTTHYPCTVYLCIYFTETYIINPIKYLFLETRRVFLFILDLQKPVFSFHYFRHPRNAVVGGKVGICSCARSHIFHSSIILICCSPFPTWCACSRPHYINLWKCSLIHGFEIIFPETNVVYFTTVEAIFAEFWLLWRIYDVKVIPNSFPGTWALGAAGPLCQKSLGCGTGALAPRAWSPKDMNNIRP